MCEGLGIHNLYWDLCFLPVALLLGDKKSLSLFGIEIHYRSIELNLCLSILNGSKPLVVTVLSSEVRLLYQVCILLLFGFDSITKLSKLVGIE